MKMNTLSTAVLFSLIGFSGGAAASTDFFGYARAGLHVSPDSSNGNGHPDYIKAEGASGRYRLGNEDDWAELGVRHDLHQEGNQRAEIGFMMGTWHNPISRSNSFTIMQAWGQLYGVMGSDITSMWAGHRYTRNLADDMLDFKHWDNTGRGVGVRDIELNESFGNSLVDLAVTYHNGDYEELGVDPDRLKSAVISPEARIHSIDFLGGNLTLGLNFAYVVDDTQLVENKGSDAEKAGYMFTVNHKANIGPAYNIFTIQANGGIGVAGWTQDAKVHLDAPGNSYRVLNNGFCTINDQWSCQYSIMYENVSMDDNNLSGKETLSVGVRPKYNWSSFTQTEVEVGYQQAESESNYGKNTAFKATLAQKFHFGGVPHIRIYATYADSETNWKEDGFGYHIADSSELDTWTFGAQFEAWW
ncbi:carbohydrate porin [Vibrio sp. 10N.247.311.51]|uniref:carbohydrate porin n=1 Tax=Vibrio sp. 10N.247.311.51 TaxID=3229996 RepID=UPI003551F303